MAGELRRRGLLDELGSASHEKKTETRQPGDDTRYGAGTAEDVLGAQGCWPATITTGPTGTALADVKLPRNRICDQRCWHCWHAPGVDNNPIFFFSVGLSRSVSVTWQMSEDFHSPADGPVHRPSSRPTCPLLLNHGTCGPSSATLEDSSSGAQSIISIAH